MLIKWNIHFECIPQFTVIWFGGCTVRFHLSTQPMKIVDIQYVCLCFSTVTRDDLNIKSLLMSY